MPAPIFSRYGQDARNPDPPEMDPKEMRLGHPTEPGVRDEKVFRQKREASAGNGFPGMPRVTPRPDGHLHGVPGFTPTGPLQRTDYDNPYGEDLGGTV